MGVVTTLPTIGWAVSLSNTIFLSNSHNNNNRDLQACHLIILWDHSLVRGIPAYRPMAWTSITHIKNTYSNRIHNSNNKLSRRQTCQFKSKVASQTWAHWHLTLKPRRAEVERVTLCNIRTRWIIKLSRIAGEAAMVTRAQTTLGLQISLPISLSSNLLWSLTKCFRIL